MQKLTAGLVETKMLRDGGYPGTLENAHWAAAQGEKIVPHLEALLEKLDAIRKREADGGSTFAFPFNAIWALGRIPGGESQRALLRFSRRAKSPEDRAMAQFAFLAHDARAKSRSKTRAVFGDSGMVELYASASQKSKVLRKLTPGQELDVLRAEILNKKEEGPRGDASVFDEIRLIGGKNNGARGFLMRAGDSFEPYW